jgi:hypothetical protein
VHLHRGRRFPVTEIPGMPGFAAAWVQAQQSFLQVAGLALAAQPAAGRAEEAFASSYRHLLGMPGLPSGLAGARPTDTGPVRLQVAAERYGRLLSEIALDAARRLGNALAEDGPDAPPITSLRELHALWIECGEAAWSAAAHREEFAAALAEFLVALVTLRPESAP